MKKTIYKPNFYEEKILWKKNYRYIIGADEVGRGAFAGPVVVGAVVFNKSIIKKDFTKEINDSKLLPPRKRVKLAALIKKEALSWSVGTVNVGTINKLGIAKSTRKAFRIAFKKIRKDLHNSRQLFLLIDGFYVRYTRGIDLKKQKAIIKGDRKSISVASASIIAKVFRDSLMKKIDKKLPQYLFAKNKGYGTKEHQALIKKYGLSKIHRQSFNLKKFTSGAPHEQ